MFWESPMFRKELVLEEEQSQNKDEVIEIPLLKSLEQMLQDPAILDQVT